MSIAGATKQNGVAVTVGTNPALLASNDSIRKAVIIANNASSGTLYIGNIGVTAANGIPIAAGTSFVDTISQDAWYGIASSGTLDVRILSVD